MAFSSIPAKRKHRRRHHKEKKEEEPEEAEDELEGGEPLLSEEDKQRFGELLMRMESSRKQLSELDPQRVDLSDYAEWIEEIGAQVPGFMVVMKTPWEAIAEMPLPEVRLLPATTYLLPDVRIL